MRTRSAGDGAVADDSEEIMHWTSGGPFRLPVVLILALALFTVSFPAGAQDVAGEPNPLAGRWSVALWLSSVGDTAVAVPLVLSFGDTAFSDRFRVFLEGADSEPLAPVDDRCAWSEMDLVARRWEDFLTIRGQVDEDRCRLDLRAIVLPDSSMTGWWCQGPWSQCRRQGPIRMDKSP